MKINIRSIGSIRANSLSKKEADKSNDVADRMCCVLASIIGVGGWIVVWMLIVWYGDYRIL